MATACQRLPGCRHASNQLLLMPCAPHQCHHIHGCDFSNPSLVQESRSHARTALSLYCWFDCCCLRLIPCCRPSAACVSSSLPLRYLSDQMKCRLPLPQRISLLWCDNFDCYSSSRVTCSACGGQGVVGSIKRALQSTSSRKIQLEGHV